MENVVTAIFKVESEAYQAFAQLRKKPFGEGYLVAEAVQLKREGEAINVVEVLDAAGVTSDDTANGMLIGSIAGILAGPLGVLLGAYTGSLTGATLDAFDAIDSISLAEVTAAKLYDGDAAIIALVQEDEPAFDAAFEGLDVTIIRRFAADVMDEVDKATEVEAELANLAHEQLRAERRAELKEKHEAFTASLTARFEELRAKTLQVAAEHEAKVDEYMDGLADQATALNAKLAEVDAAVGEAIHDLTDEAEDAEA